MAIKKLPVKHSPGKFERAQGKIQPNLGMPLPQREARWWTLSFYRVFPGSPTSQQRDGPNSTGQLRGSPCLEEHIEALGGMVQRWPLHHSFAVLPHDDFAPYLDRWIAESRWTRAERRILTLVIGKNKHGSHGSFSSTICFFNNGDVPQQTSQTVWLPEKSKG